MYSAKIAKLIKEYNEINKKRHSLYCKKSKIYSERRSLELRKLNMSREFKAYINDMLRRCPKWTLKDQENLLKVRRQKLRASKKLRTELKKRKLIVVWGTRNQVCRVDTIEKRKADIQEMRIRRATAKANYILSDTLCKLDLIS